MADNIKESGAVKAVKVGGMRVAPPTHRAVEEADLVAQGGGVGDLTDVELRAKEKSVKHAHQTGDLTTKGTVRLNTNQQGHVDKQYPTNFYTKGGRIAEE